MANKLRGLMSVAVIFATFMLTVAAQERFVLPVDEASQDASFAAFRTKLIAAVERRDASFILGILDSKIQLSFGGDAGIMDFKRIWRVQQKDSKFWAAMLPIVKNGGRFDNVVPGVKRFEAPYTFGGFPQDLDEFSYSSIFGNNVRLRSSPGVTAPVVTELSYNIVSVDFAKSIKTKGSGDDDSNYDWYKVTTLGGKTGFVKAEFVRSPIDLRAGFEKKRGAWKMVFFIVGD
ncbi:hypothetical protein BH10ACI2_BH10ACI2_08480 [soil metagenome]